MPSLLPDQDWCKDCGLLLFIANKHYGLCADCNYKRTHHGETRAQVAQRRHRERLARTQPQPVPKRRARPKRTSAKKQLRDDAMHVAYAQIDATRDPVCSGCDRGDVALSHSHLLSQKQRTDLAADPDNIKLHCFGDHYSCHDVWERAVPAELAQMRDLRENLRYIAANDRHRYEWLKDKFASCNVPFPELSL